MKSIEDIMKRFSKAELTEGIERAKALMNTPEGAQIREKLASMDKNELMRKLNELEAASSGGGRSAQNASNREILDRLNKFCNRE